MPGSLYIAKHIWNIFPIQIKNIFIITSKSACWARMQMRMANGIGPMSIFLVWGAAFCFLMMWTW